MKKISRLAAFAIPVASVALLSPIAPTSDSYVGIEYASFNQIE